MSEEQLPTLDIASHNLGVERGRHKALQDVLELMDTLPLHEAVERMITWRDKAKQAANTRAKPYCAGLEVGL